MTSTNLLKRNEALLRNLYAHGSFERHAFVCFPELLQVYDHPDYDPTISDKPIEGWVPQTVENYRRQLQSVEALGDDAVPVARLICGTHLYAAAFGCEVHRFPDNNPCALPLVTSAAEAEKLEEPDLWKSPSLYRVFELAHAVQKELGKEAYLGVPDMQSGFDTAALVWEKASFLCAMIDDEEKEAVKRLVGKCARLFKKFLLEFRKEFPNCSPCHCPGTWCPPGMGPWLSNDECGAFSVEMFHEFCLPELVDLAQTFGGLGMHCCAAAEHQFESFKLIPNFYAFNRVAAQRGYAPLLDALTGPSAPVHVLGWISEDEAAMLMRNAPAGTRFIFNLKAATVDEGKAWLARMRAVNGK